MKALDIDQMQLIGGILLFEKEDLQQFLVAYTTFFNNSFLSKILQKRIDVFKLPKLEPSAIMVLSTLCENPGKVILGLIETLEKAEILKPKKIDGSFICSDVYPMGFYDDEEFDKEWEIRKEKHNEGFNKII